MPKDKPLSHEQIKKEMLRWLFEPLYWAKKFCGPDFDPWSGQEELWNNYGKLLNAKLKRYQAGPASLTPEESILADKMGISIMSGHGMGKERSVSGIGFHYLHVISGYRPKGVCTAPAGPTLHTSNGRTRTRLPVLLSTDRLNIAPMTEFSSLSSEEATADTLDWA